MVIEKTSQEIIVRLPANVDPEDLQDVVDYLSYKAATADSRASQSDVDELAAQTKRGWWSQNRDRLLR